MKELYQNKLVDAILCKHVLIRKITGVEVKGVRLQHREKLSVLKAGLLANQPF